MTKPFSAYLSGLNSKNKCPADLRRNPSGTVPYESFGKSSISQEHLVEAMIASQRFFLNVTASGSDICDALQLNSEVRENRMQLFAAYDYAARLSAERKGIRKYIPQRHAARSLRNHVQRTDRVRCTTLQGGKRRLSPQHQK